MSELYDLQELVDHSGLPERTVRYYLAKVLDAPGGVRGRKTFYPREILDQLKLARQVLTQDYDSKRGEVKPSLMDFKRWMKSLSADDIRTMVTMPYGIKPKTPLAASAPRPAGARFEEPRASYSFDEAATNRKTGKEDGKKTTESAARYLDKVMGTDMGPAPEPLHHRRWRSYRFGDDLVIRTRERLTPEQEQQLRLAGKLLQSILKEKRT